MTPQQKLRRAYQLLEQVAGENDDAHELLQPALDKLEDSNGAIIATFEDEFGNPIGAECGRDVEQERSDYVEAAS